MWTKQIGSGARKSFVPTNVAKGAVPDGGKFFEFVPERGAAEWSGNAGKATGNEVHGEINRVHRPTRVHHDERNEVQGEINR